MDLDNILSGASADSPKTENKTAKQKKKTENKAENKNNFVPASVPASPSPAFASSSDNDLLPPDLLQTIQSIINQWCIDNEIESMQKAASLQWRAACLYIGQYVKNNRLLIDEDKLKKNGGSIYYNIKKVSSLVDLWEYLCTLYKKTPLSTDFIAFSGVSHEWFYNNSRDSLTSSGGLIWKKVTSIQAGGIASGIVDGRENPTGKIYFSKAVLGWSENGSRLPASDELTENSTNSLPDLGGYGLPVVDS